MTPTVILFLYFLLRSAILLPLKDNRPRRRSFPWMTLAIVLINVVIHSLLVIWVLPQPRLAAWRTLYPYTEIPALTMRGEGVGALASFTHTYLHGGLDHLLGNMIVLWFFGRKVEDATGPLGFLLFYTLCGFSASLLSVIAFSTLIGSTVNTLGASGAISGIMGAYLFLYAGEKVQTLVLAAIPLPFDWRVPLIWVFRLPAWLIILQFMLGDALWAQMAIENPYLFRYLGVNVFSHIGGAIGGMLFVLLFVHPRVLAAQR